MTTLLSRITTALEGVLTTALAPLRSDVRTLLGEVALLKTDRAALAEQVERLVLAASVTETTLAEIQEALVLLVTGTPDPAPTDSVPCAASGCQEQATVMAVVPGHGEVPLCDGHGQVVARNAMQAPKREKVICEYGYDHSDEPDYVPGQIHAHVLPPTPEEFAEAEGLVGEPDEAILHPEPMDDISAMIEAAYQARKPQIDAALDAQGSAKPLSRSQQRRKDRTHR